MQLLLAFGMSDTTPDTPVPISWGFIILGLAGFLCLIVGIAAWLSWEPSRRRATRMLYVLAVLGLCNAYLISRKLIDVISMLHGTSEGSRHRQDMSQAWSEVIGDLAEKDGPAVAVWALAFVVWILVRRRDKAAMNE